MSTWLIEAEISVLLFVMAFPLLIAPLLHVVYRRYGRFAGPPAFWAVITTFYGLGVLAFTVFPLPDVQPGFCESRADAEVWQFIPGANILPALESVFGAGAAGLTGSAFLQVFFNVIMFIPLGFLIAYLAKKPLWFALGAGLTGSLLIELTQGTAIWGIYPCAYRNADVDDLILNTLGAGVGWVIGRALSRVAPHKDPEPVPDLGPPTRRRRATAFAVDIILWSTFAIIVQILVDLELEAQGTKVETILGWNHWILLGTGIVLFLLVPLVRPDRATPGQVSVQVQPIVAQIGQPPAATSVLIKFAVRWLPILVWNNALLIVGPVELVTVLVRTDNRSLSSVLAGTTTITMYSVREEASAAETTTD